VSEARPIGFKHAEKSTEAGHHKTAIVRPSV
jgi:hypothetical protein